MVRLKAGDAMLLYNSRLFQFQYGAIERTSHPAVQHWSDPFQFQYGAIES